MLEKSWRLKGAFYQKPLFQARMTRLHRQEAILITSATSRIVLVCPLTASSCQHVNKPISPQSLMPYLLLSLYARSSNQRSEAR